MKLEKFGRTIVITYPSFLEVILPDGQVIPSLPQDDDDYWKRAERLGYGRDTLRMCLDHDRLHALLCEALGLEVSPALYAVANHFPPTDLTGAEEDLVLAAQRFLQLSRRRGLVEAPVDTPC